MPEVYSFDALSPDTVQLDYPCAANANNFGTAFVGGVDLNGAGGPDFVVADRTSKRVMAFDHTLAPLDCFSVANTPDRFGSLLDFGDVDGDGEMDIFVSHDDAGDPRRDAYVFYNDGLGRFGVGADEAGRLANVVVRSPALKKIGFASAGDFTGRCAPANPGEQPRCTTVDIVAAVKGAGAADPVQVVLYYTQEN